MSNGHISNHNSLKNDWRQLPLAELKRKVTALKKLANEMDPYGDLSLKHRRSLEKFGIVDHGDPFAITNRLLLLLEDSLTELSKRQSDQT
jgi:hypothetical protein